MWSWGLNVEDNGIALLLIKVDRYYVQTPVVGISLAVVPTTNDVPVILELS